MHRVPKAVLACAVALSASACAGVACPEPPDVKAELKDPAKVFPVFQELVRSGLYGKAYDCLSLGAQRSLRYEQFFFAFTAFEASRRMIGTLRVHAVDAAAPRVRLCSADFGVGREFSLKKLGEHYLLDLTSDDVEFLKGRALSWHRFQVKRADGWHFAYPPDWAYAPLGRSCICGRTT